MINQKRGQNFERVVSEWETKVSHSAVGMHQQLTVQATDLQSELDASNNESRNYSLEVCRLKACLEDVNEQSDVVKRENKNLADEIRDLLDQLGEGGRSIHELEKQRRRLEVKIELLSRVKNRVMEKIFLLFQSLKLSSC